MSSQGSAAQPRASRIYLSVPHMHGPELGFVTEAFQSNWLTTAGPNLAALEREFSELTGLPSVALSTGTAAIHLGLKLLGVGNADEVVTPTLSFAASCNPIRYQDATPILIDSERNTWNLDPDILATFLKKRAHRGRLPKAVIVVHLFGQSAGLDSILQICSGFGIPVLEDAAESLGAYYNHKHTGTFGAIGAFSFNGNKIITGTTGGMLVAQDTAQLERARKWSTQARDADPSGVNNYVHSELGYNYRMSNVIAGIVRGQLRALDLRVAQRRKVFERYRDAFADLPGIEPQPEAACRHGVDQAGGPRSIRHTRWLSCFLVNEREFGMSSSDLIRSLDRVNVESRPVWKPMHLQPLYGRCERWGGEVAEDLNKRGICLPSSSSLSEADQQFVIEQIRRAHKDARA